MAVPHAPVVRPSRRSLLGVVAAVPALVAVVGASSTPAVGAAVAAEEVELECLADLIETGEVTRADLVAG